MTQTLVKKYDLQKYVSAPTTSQKGTKSITDLLSEGDLGLGIESLARDRMQTNALQTIYPTIDSSFLKMKHQQCYDFKEHGFEVILPRFAVYSLDSPNCVVALAIEAINYTLKNEDYGLDFCDSETTCRDKRIKEPTLPNELASPLIAAISIKGNDPKRRIRKTVRGEFTFSSQFIGYIPKNIKDEIKVAKKVFGKELYVIAEADRWKNEEIKILSSKGTGDPLIIGVKGQRCFLISEFNCTPLEHYVKEELECMNVIN